MQFSGNSILATSVAAFVIIALVACVNNKLQQQAIYAMVTQYKNQGKLAVQILHQLSEKSPHMTKRQNCGNLSESQEIHLQKATPPTIFRQTVNRHTLHAGVTSHLSRQTILFYIQLKIINSQSWTNEEVT